MSEQSPPLKKRPSLPFDPAAFLETAAKGTRSTARTKSSFRRGRPPDLVFYIKNGKVKVTVVSKLGKEAEQDQNVDHAA